jgi:aminoglycoside 2'-N-acetyltransferase I
MVLRTLRTNELDEATRSAVIRLCIDAHQEEDFRNLFSYLPPDGLHVLADLGGELVGHAVVTTRWLQPLDLPLLRTAYVDAVATSPAQQRRGVGSAVMSHLASVVVDFDVACLDRSECPSTNAWAGKRGVGRSRAGRTRG